VIAGQDPSPGAVLDETFEMQTVVPDAVVAGHWIASRVVGS
jgi:hypothetical protein